MPHLATRWSCCSLSQLPSVTPKVSKCQKCDIKVFDFLISKSQDEDSQMMTEVDLFISTKAVKVLNADTQVSNSSS